MRPNDSDNAPNNASNRSSNGALGSLITIDEALARIRLGKMVIVVDDEDRENEGDFTLAGDLVTPEAVNFMAQFGRGLICLALDSTQVERLQLGMMGNANGSKRGTAFTVSIDGKDGITTGISAAERARTIQLAANPQTRPDQLVTPGHIFPIRAVDGGVLVRSGHTEAGVDLARLAGRHPSAVICEIMRDDGEMARMPDLETLAEKHDIGIIRIADLISYRLERESLVEKVFERQGVASPWGGNACYRLVGFRSTVGQDEYLAWILGTLRTTRWCAYTRRHPLLTFLGRRQPRLRQCESWMQRIEAEGEGVFVYLMHGSRPSVLNDFRNVIGSADTQTPAADPTREETTPSDTDLTPQKEATLRSFGLGAQVLAALGLKSVRLLTNSQRRIAGLEGFGIQVTGYEPLKSSV